MRNLSLYALSVTRLPNAKISATAVDVDENNLYAASEFKNPDGDVDVELWKFPISQKDEIDSPSTPFALFTAPVAAHAPEARQIVSLRILPETRHIVAIMRGGDITLLSLETDSPMADVEGTFESGILAAAWSPDDLFLALVTGEEKLIIMTSTLDILSEAPIETADFGEDAPINVGWGSKQTQFHGSLGKAAAQAPAQIKIGSSPDDDELPRISWRGDAQYFVVSKLSSPAADGQRRRILRVYNQHGALQSTSEAVGGLEHSLSWRPSGNLIAGTQRFGFEGGGAGKKERHDVVFFERNGLRHGEFGLRVKDLDLGGTSSKRPWGYRVHEVLWNSESNILSLWIETEKGDLVQLWTIGNYHWYLKQEISASILGSNDGGSRFTSVNWHPENPHLLILTTESSIMTRSYAWETFTSHSQPPVDSGSVAVFDGSSILLTPLRTQNVPPPMSSHQLSLALDLSVISSACVSRIPVYASFSSEADHLAILWETGYIEYWDLKTRLGPGPGKVMDPVKIWSGVIGGDVRSWRQILVRSLEEHFVIYAIGASQEVNIIATVKVDKDGTVDSSRLISVHPVIAVQDSKGEIHEFDPQTLDRINAGGTFPEFCLLTRAVPLSSTIADSPQCLYIGLGARGKLYVTGRGHEPKVLAPNATSFTIASGFVIYTTSAHDAWFVPLNVLQSVLSVTEDEVKSMASTWETRKVERGSRIVMAVPSSMSLVLQMPRGNLETINPRPLVMEVVKQDLRRVLRISHMPLLFTLSAEFRGNYRKAFLACRKHRIDLTVLVEHDPKAFFDRVSSFVKQVDEVDYINLFLTVIGLTKYVNSILTAFVVKTPPDHESGLALLLRLRDEHPNIVEDAVKYIIFLVDVDLLFNTAFGMYDFSLVLMIAQHSQKDPREYLPFLRELRALDKFYQRFRIDDHLKRREKALRNLHLAGPEHFQEAIKYIDDYQLYEPALSIWRNTDEYNTILELYGDWLFDRREFRSAAVVYVEAQKLPKAMKAHERALEWREVFTIASILEVPEEEIIDVGYRMADDLVSKKRHSEAGQVLLDYAKDVRQAVIAFVEGNCFSEARRVIAINGQPELIEDIVYPAALGGRAQISEDLGEMREQLRKQLNRIRELRIRKVEEPDAFYGTDDPTLHNVDVMTDISMPATTFTRYTAAPSTVSRTSKRSSRSKRKLERKVGSGRKGTVDEEEYLLKSITKLVGRFNTTRDEARDVLPHLFQFTSEHREEGRALQAELSEFEEELGKALEEVWTKATDEDVPPIDSWAARMEERERTKAVNPIDKVPKPELSRGENWRIRLYELGGA
ncbi:pol II transcription elongation factor [Amanita rubescens]|nr:pol II transcription elongation factor [Amanita rubescens]